MLRKIFDHFQLESKFYKVPTNLYWELCCYVAVEKIYLEISALTSWWTRPALRCPERPDPATAARSWVSSPPPAASRLYKPAPTILLQNRPDSARGHSCSPPPQHASVYGGRELNSRTTEADYRGRLQSRTTEADYWAVLQRRTTKPYYRAGLQSLTTEPDYRAGETEPALSKLRLNWGGLLEPSPTWLSLFAASRWRRHKNQESQWTSTRSLLW